MTAAWYMRKAARLDAVQHAKAAQRQTK